MREKEESRESHASRTNAKKVHILHNPGQLLAVDNLTVEVSKKGKDQIHWLSTSENFQVKFEDSPFEKKIFDHTNPYSGPPKQETAERKYKYTVTVGNDVLDPEVEVRG